MKRIFIYFFLGTLIWSGDIFSQDLKGENMEYSKEEKKFLLGIARESIKNYFREKRPLEDIKIDDPLLEEKRGAFVTLKEQGRLRGCIGRIVADLPLYKAVSWMACEAAFKDPRFPPLEEKELKDIILEISILSPFKKIDNVEEIEVGKHGVMLRKGWYSGLLLPQVAQEYNWDKYTFLDHTCLKAGLGYGCWRDKDVDIYIFSAEVFSEEEFD